MKLTGRRLGSSTALVLVGTLGFLITFHWESVYNARTLDVTPRVRQADAVPFADAWLAGRETAQVGVLEFTDFHCPACSKFASTTWPVIAAAYIDTGKIRFALRHMPLRRSHPRAPEAALAADCAGAQGRFWQAHDLLFSGRLTGPDDFASRAGLDLVVLNACMSSPSARIDSDVALAKRLQVRATPTFFFGRVQSDGRLKVTKRVTGAIPLDAFKAVVNALLARDVN